MEIHGMRSDNPARDTHPIITISCVSNVYVRQLHYRKIGDFNDPHTHPHDHLTLLAAGSVTVNVDGQITEYTAPAMIFVSKNQLHHFTATADDTMCYCIHALRTGERVEDIVDPAQIPAGTKAVDMARPVADLRRPRRTETAIRQVKK